MDFETPRSSEFSCEQCQRALREQSARLAEERGERPDLARNLELENLLELGVI